MLREESYNEKDLLFRIAAGDEQSFAVLFNRYWSQVYVHVLSYVKNVPLAEDITQDIFFGIWTHRQKLPEIQVFEYYLRTITRHRTISELRKKLHQFDQEPEERIPEFSFSNVPDSPADQLDRKQAAETVQKAIDLLPPRRKQVFQMSRQEGLSHAEIADRLQISKATVNEHIGEALVFLRTYLANYPELLTVVPLIIGCWLKRK